MFDEALNKGLWGDLDWESIRRHQKQVKDISRDYMHDLTLGRSSFASERAKSLLIEEVNLVRMEPLFSGSTSPMTYAEYCGVLPQIKSLMGLESLPKKQLIPTSSLGKSSRMLGLDRGSPEHKGEGLLNESISTLSVSPSVAQRPIRRNRRASESSIFHSSVSPSAGHGGLPVSARKSFPPRTVSVRRLTDAVKGISPWLSRVRSKGGVESH